MLQRTMTRPYVVIVDGVWRQADVLDVPPQLRQHLHRNILSYIHVLNEYFIKSLLVELALSR